MRWWLYLGVALGVSLGAVGCGGSSTSDDDDDDAEASGVSGSVYLDEVSAAEQQRLCEWVIGAQGGPGEKRCSSDTTVTTSTVAECASSDITIHCTVAMMEACVRSLGGDPCKVTTSPSTSACEAYIQCAATDAGG